MPTPQEVFDNPLQYLDFLQSANFEGQRFDRKEARIDNGSQIQALKEKIKQCISAFANYSRNGGLLVLGIADDGTITGTQHIDESTMNNILQVRLDLTGHSTITQDVDLQDSGKNHLYLLYTPWADKAICETLGSFPKGWRRDGPQNFPLTQPDREQLKREKKIVDFELSYCCPYDPDELDEGVVKEFKKAFLETRGAQYGHNTKEVLYQAGALIKEKENDKYAFTNAGYLFFASNPRKRFANAFVRVLKYDICDEDLENKADTILDRDFDGALPNVIRNLRTFLKDSVLFQILDEPEYPSIAVDEALVNAVIHRDYAITVPIRCTAYKDKLVVKNPGGILQPVPQHFSLTDINLESVPRNPKLVEWMRLIKDENDGFLVRALSEGTRRMLEEMEHIGLLAPDYITNNYTTVTLLNNTGVNNTREKTQKYPSYTETEVQEHPTLPDSWIHVKLSKLITLESGLRPRGGVKGILEGVPSLGGEHLNDLGGFHYENMKYIPDDFFEALNYGRIFQNDILVVKDGATTGKTSFVDKNFPYTHAAVNEHVFIVRVTPEIAIPNFVFYYLFSNKGQDLIRLDFRGATIGGISRNFPKKIEIPLPPLAEQHRIIVKLETLFAQLDTAVDNLKEAQAQLQQYRRSLLKAAFEGELTTKWRERYPDKDKSNSWKSMKLSQFIALESGSRPRGGVRGILEGIPSLGGEHLNADGGFDFEKIKYVPKDFFKSLSKGHIYPKDILVVKDGATTGKTSFVSADFPYEHAAVNEHVFIVRVDPKVAFPQFVFYYLFSSEGQKQILSDFRGATVGGISRNFPLKVSVPIPSLDEQKQIVSELEQQLSVADEIEVTLDTELKRTERLRQSILKHAFSGKLVLQDPHDEPASVLLEKIQDEKEQQQPKEKKTIPKSKTTLSAKQMLLPLN